MKNPLDSLHQTLGLGLVIVIILALCLHFGLYGEKAYWQFIFRWLHVFFGILWIGLLYYFNFVQTPSMPKIPDEQKPAISKVIAPAALYYFRWAAAFTVLTGLILGWLNGWIDRALLLQPPARTIGIGMWLALIMAFNVWFIIWPNQKKVLGIVTAGAEEKATAAKKAGFASRLNTMLSIPMLFCMVAQQNGGF